MKLEPPTQADSLQPSVRLSPLTSMLHVQLVEELSEQPALVPMTAPTTTRTPIATLALIIRP